MNAPTVQEMLRSIEKRAMRPEWFDGGMSPMLLDENHIWYRHPDRDMILKITVEELPRSEWPDFTANLPPKQNL